MLNTFVPMYNGGAAMLCRVKSAVAFPACVHILKLWNNFTLWTI